MMVNLPYRFVCEDKKRASPESSNVFANGPGYGDLKTRRVPSSTRDPNSLTMSHISYPRCCGLRLWVEDEAGQRKRRPCSGIKKLTVNLNRQTLGRSNAVTCLFDARWSNEKRTSCPYPSDRPPSGHRPGRRQARHSHIFHLT